MVKTLYLMVKTLYLMVKTLKPIHWYVPFKDHKIIQDQAAAARRLVAELSGAPPATASQLTPEAKPRGKHGENTEKSWENGGKTWENGGKIVDFDG